MRSSCTTLRIVISVSHCNVNGGIVWTASYTAVGLKFETRRRLIRFYFHVLIDGAHVSYSQNEMAAAALLGAFCEK